MSEPLIRKAGLLDDATGLCMVPLGVLLYQKYGIQYITWSPEALIGELRSSFGNVGDQTWERIQAVVLLLANDSYWREWNVFEKVTATAVGVPPIFSLTQPPESEDMAISLSEASTIATNTFSDEVLRYMAAACLSDGLWYLEPPLDVCKDSIAEYDRSKGIVRDLGAVRDRVKGLEDYISSPSDSTDVQANNVVSVRKALKEYNSRVQTQLRRVAK